MFQVRKFEGGEDASATLGYGTAGFSFTQISLTWYGVFANLEDFRNWLESHGWVTSERSFAAWSREAFNGAVRRECLTLRWFTSLPEAQYQLQTWQTEYDNFRPHRSLGLRTPSGTPRVGGYRSRPAEAAS
jgi:putative transposase